VLGVAVDITERKQAQGRIQLNAELETTRAVSVQAQLVR
jgi:hypothetical protein